MSTSRAIAIGAAGTAERSLTLRFPDHGADLPQDEEWCELRVAQQWRRLRFHDYDEIYRVPGLYESLFYRALRCNSPKRVVGLLREVMADAGQRPDGLRVLDVGAGNGMVGEELRHLGVAAVHGIDIIAEARDATLRDRPWVYDEYHVVDLCDLPEPVEKRLRRAQLNALTVVAALGFGDVPAAAFLGALDLLEPRGWLAFNIKEDFIQDRDDSGFAELLRQLRSADVIRMQAYRRYRHRLSAQGRPLHYVAMVATKERDLPDEFTEIASKLDLRHTAEPGDNGHGEPAR